MLTTGTGVRIGVATSRREESTAAMNAPAGTARSLVGRARERTRIADFACDVLARRSSSLGVWGPPGSGKSALLAGLDTVGARLLRATGDPAESGVRAAVLHQLTASLVHPPNAATAGDPALLAALTEGLGDATVAAEDVLPLLAASLDRLAADTPLIVVLDDIDRADPFSIEVLTRLMPRARSWGVAVAGRQPPRALPATADTLHLGPLSDEAARTLASRYHDGADDEQRGLELVDDIVRWAAGNPGVVVRLARALLTPEVLRTGSTVDLRRRVGSAVATLWLPRQDLSPDAEALGLIWAVALDCPSGDAGVPEQLIDDAALAELITAGLLARDSGRVVPVHPLLPAAALELAPSSSLRRTHALLADSVGPDGLAAAWHRAQASTAADEAVADRLDRAVVTADTNLAPASRARALELAVTLSADPVRRAERLSRAAEARLLAGDSAGAEAMLQRVDGAPEATRARVLLLEGLVAAATRTPQEGFERLIDAARLARDRDAGIELMALAGAAEVAWWSGRTDWAIDTAERATQLRGTDAATHIVVEAVLGGAAMFAGDFGAAGRHLGAAVAAGAGGVTAADHRMAGQAAMLLGDDLASNRHLAESARLSREEGDAFRRAFTLLILTSVETWRGHLDRAESALAEGRALIRRAGDERSKAFELSISAHLGGLRGAGSATTAAASAALKLVTGRDVGYLPASALWALGRSDLATGRLASALEHLEEVTDPASARAHPSAALFAIPDLVEAAARSGRAEAARAALPRFQAWAAAGSPWAAAVLPRLLALTATTAGEAERWYREGSADPDRPFERARTQLLHGEHLRRGRQRVRARAVLEDARSTFHDLGMVSWAERATTELNATAERARRGPDAATELTPQELTVARLVAEGATNKNVAEQLFLSRKTVESHLHKVYTKMGISSRKQLADALPPEN
jgi:DNA-binding CsgD family transcriptional regulator